MVERIEEGGEMEYIGGRLELLELFSSKLRGFGMGFFLYVKRNVVKGEFIHMGSLAHKKYTGDVCTYVDTVGRQGTLYQTRVVAGNSTTLDLGLGSSNQLRPSWSLEVALRVETDDSKPSVLSSSLHQTRRGGWRAARFRQQSNAAGVPGQLETAALHGSPKSVHARRNAAAKNLKS